MKEKVDNCDDVPSTDYFGSAGFDCEEKENFHPVTQSTCRNRG